MKTKLLALLLAAVTVCSTTLPALAAAPLGNAPVSSSSSVPSKGKLRIKEVEYERKDRELEIEFSRRVQFKKPRVVVKNAKGKALKVKILEKDRDGIEVRVKGMKLGRRYTVKVSGVRAVGSKTYTSVSKKFIAVDND